MGVRAERRKLLDVRDNEIYEMWRGGELMKDISKKFDLSHTSINKILKDRLASMGKVLKKYWHPIGER